MPDAELRHRPIALPRQTDRRRRRLRSPGCWRRFVVRSGSSTVSRHARLVALEDRRDRPASCAEGVALRRTRRALARDRAGVARREDHRRPRWRLITAARVQDCDEELAGDGGGRSSTSHGAVTTRTCSWPPSTSGPARAPTVRSRPRRTSSRSRSSATAVSAGSTSPSRPDRPSSMCSRSSPDPRPERRDDPRGSGRPRAWCGSVRSPPSGDRRARCAPRRLLHHPRPHRPGRDRIR